MMEQATKTFQLRLERTIRAKRARVFQAFTTAEDLQRWSAPAGAEVIDGELDLRVGGRWGVVMRDVARNVEYHATGVYREISPPERLVYTHQWLTDPTPVETVITVEFFEEGDATRVVMVHDGFLSAEARDGHEAGWASCFDRLEEMFA
jgi:uncharacterized protein YndB with AHSA1/START domain